MKYLALILVIVLSVSDSSIAATIAASSASLTDVQAAYDSASSGDTITIPNGSATWSSGLDMSTPKQVIIKALNYTPTPAGNQSGQTTWSGLTNRNVKITHNSSSDLFPFTQGNTYFCGVIGIEFIEQASPAAGAMVTFSGNGTKQGVIIDCVFPVALRSFPTDQIIQFLGRGGYIKNTFVRGIWSGLNDVGNGSILIKPASGIRNWETDSTMGTLDTDGNYNVYCEDTTLYRVGQCPDIDDHGRFVGRYLIYDTAWGLTHGFSSLWGGRHFEFYNNRYTNTLDLANISARYFWVRAGTGVFTDNAVANFITPSEYGAPTQMSAGDNTTPTAYLMDRQPGCGYTGGSYVSEPIYIWNNTGARAYSVGVDSTPDDWTSNVQIGRDIIVDSGAKPSYTKYTYPHPVYDQVLAQIDGGGGSPAVDGSKGSFNRIIRRGRR